MNYIKVKLLSLIFFNSCETNLNNNTININEEKILWNSTDEYPSIKLCNDLKETALIRKCFQAFLSNQIFIKLTKKEILINKSIDDTVIISLLINNKGKISINNESIPKNVSDNIPDFQNIIRIIIDSLPNVLPATKTNLGVSVNSKFELPIILKSKQG